MGKWLCRNRGRSSGLITTSLEKGPARHCHTRTLRDGTSYRTHACSIPFASPTIPNRAGSTFCNPERGMEKVTGRSCRSSFVKVILRKDTILRNQEQPVSSKHMGCLRHMRRLKHSREVGRGGRVLESTTPLPIWVSQKGRRSCCTRRRSMLLVSLRLPPAPTTSSGCFASWPPPPPHIG